MMTLDLKTAYCHGANRERAAVRHWLKGRIAQYEKDAEANCPDGSELQQELLGNAEALRFVLDAIQRRVHLLDKHKGGLGRR